MKRYTKLALSRTILLFLLYTHGQPQIGEAVREQACGGVSAAKSLCLFIVIGSVLQGVAPVLAQLHHHL